MKEKLKEKLQYKNRLKTSECPNELDIWAREFYTEEILGGIFIGVKVKSILSSTFGVGKNGAMRYYYYYYCRISILPRHGMNKK